jgi:hypothetical protein
MMLSRPAAQPGADSKDLVNMLQQTREQSGPMTEADVRALHWTIDDLASRSPPPQPQNAQNAENAPSLETAESIEESIRVQTASTTTGSGNQSPMQAAGDDGWDTPAGASPPPENKSGMR